MFAFFCSQVVELESQLLFFSFPVVSKITSDSVLFCQCQIVPRYPVLRRKKQGTVESLVSFLYVSLFAQGSGSPRNTEETALDLVHHQLRKGLEQFCQSANVRTAA